MGETERKKESAEVRKKYGWNEKPPVCAAAKENISSDAAATIAVTGNPAVTMAVKVLQFAKKSAVTVARNLKESGAKKGEDSGSNGLLTVLVLCAVIIFVIPAVIVTSVVGLEETIQQEAKNLAETAEKEAGLFDSNTGGEKYKDWYGADGDWEGMFVSWCANACGYTAYDIIPKMRDASGMAQWFKDRSLWLECESGYEPKAGDIIFLKSAPYVAVVTGYNSVFKKVTVVGGNMDGKETTEEHPHRWKTPYVCKTCGGDHLVDTVSECDACGGTGYRMSHASYYDGKCMLLGCSSCGGGGTRIVSGCSGRGFCSMAEVTSDNSFRSGSGRLEGERECSVCFASGKYKGRITYCTKNGCKYNSEGAWAEYPDGICYVSGKEYHETSKVKSKTYDLSSREIAGYGIPDYLTFVLEKEKENEDTY